MDKDRSLLKQGTFNTKRGVGVVVYTADHIKYKLQSDLESSAVESIWLETFLISSVYRPPSSSAQWINQLSLQTEKAASTTDEINCLGYFNINLLGKDTQARTWSHSFEAYDFSQLIKEPTRVTAHSATLIDHIYSYQPDKITDCFVPTTALSDHYPVCFTRQTSKLQTKKRNHNSIKHTSLTNFEDSAFLDDLSKEIENFKRAQNDSNILFFNVECAVLVSSQ